MVRVDWSWLSSTTGRRRSCAPTKAGHELEVTADHLVWKCSDEHYGASSPPGATSRRHTSMVPRRLLRDR